MKMSKSDIRHILLSVLFAVFALSVAAVCLLQAKTLAAFAQDEQAGATEKSVDVSMTLNDNLIVNFAVPEDAGASASVAFNGKDYTLQGTLTDGKYKFSFDGVTPQYMTEAITFTAGEYTLSKPLSVQTYCEGLLSGTAEELGLGSLEYAVLRELATDILNYGAAAQTYLQMDAEALPNANVDQSLATVYDLTPTSPSVDNEGEVKWYSAGMVCGSKPSLYVRIVLPAGKTADAYTVKADTDAAEYQRTETVNGMQVATYYYDSLSVLEFYKDMNLTVWEGETQVSGTLSYSVHDYISAMADSSTAGTSDLVKALYGYGKAAVAYANADKFNEYTIDAAAGTVSRAYDDGNYSWVYPVANVNEDLTIVGSDVTLSVTGSDAEATVGNIKIEATESFTFAAGTLNSGRIDTAAATNTVAAGATLNVSTDGAVSNGFDAENVALFVYGTLNATSTTDVPTDGTQSGVTAKDITVGTDASFTVDGYALGVYMNAGGAFSSEGTVAMQNVLRFGLRTGDGDTLAVSGGTFTVSGAQEGAISFANGGEMTLTDGAVTVDGGVQIGTLRMKGGAFDLTNQAAVYNIVNFELADGVFSAKDTLRTDKLVVKGGTMDIAVDSNASGDDPSGITPCSSDAEGQRYYFLGGKVTLNRTGANGSGGLFSWSAGGNIAVVVAGQTRIDVGGFDWAVILGDVTATFFGFTQNNPDYGLHYTTANGISAANGNINVWETSYWTDTVGVTVTTTSTDNNASELCGKALQFTHDVDFETL